jgi:hypothetical protein
MTEPLSPAARAVLDAFTEDHFLHDWKHNHYNTDALAAALRAAADQVVPEPDDIDKGSLSLAAIRNRCKVRDQLLAIAAELEGGNG